MGAFVCLTLLLPNLNANIVIVRCILVVVRHILYTVRFSGYRADVSCFASNICLNSTIQTNRCGRICLFNLTVAEFECKYRVCECILVVVRHIIYSERFSSYRVDVSCFTTKICLVIIIQTGRYGRICLFNLTVAQFECMQISFL